MEYLVVGEWLQKNVIAGTTTGYMLVSSGAVLCYYAVKKWFSEPSPNLPPCPYIKWPIVGNIPQLFQMKKYAFETLNDFACMSKYNKIFMIYLGPTPLLVLGHIDVVKEALVKNMNAFAGRPKIYSGLLLTDGGKDILFGEYGDTWKYHRKLAHSSVKKFASGRNLERIVQESLTKTVDQLNENLDSPINVKPFLVHFVFNISCCYSFGTSYDMDDEDFLKFVNITSEFIEVLGNGLPGDIHPLLSYLPTSKEKKVKELMKLFMDFLTERHNECKKNLNRNDHRCITDSLLDLHATDVENGVDDESFTEKHIIMTVFDIFGAGIDTMTTVLHTFIAHMIENPQIQQKIKNELDAVYGSSSRLPTLADRVKLPYTEACVNETLRLATLAPLGFPLETLADVNIAGYDIPKGTMVVSNIWALHRDPSQWFNPEKFDPLRFLEPLKDDDSDEVYDSNETQRYKTQSYKTQSYKTQSYKTLDDKTLDDRTLDDRTLDDRTTEYTTVDETTSEESLRKIERKKKPMLNFEDIMKSSKMKTEYKLLNKKPCESYLPFGAGRRMCIGEGLARSTLMMAIPGLMRRFTVSSVAIDQSTIGYQRSAFALLPELFKCVVTADAEQSSLYSSSSSTTTTTTMG